MPCADQSFETRRNPYVRDAAACLDSTLDGPFFQLEEALPTSEERSHETSTLAFVLRDRRALGFPSELAIDDNVIGRTDPDANGVGIYMIGFAEPRIISNDIWVNFTGIEIHATTQPAVLARAPNARGAVTTDDLRTSPLQACRNTPV